MPSPNPPVGTVAARDRSGSAAVSGQTAVTLIAAAGTQRRLKITDLAFSWPVIAANIAQVYYVRPSDSVVVDLARVNMGGAASVEPGFAVFDFAGNNRTLPANTPLLFIQSANVAINVTYGAYVDTPSTLGVPSVP